MLKYLFESLLSIRLGEGIAGSYGNFMLNSVYIFKVPQVIQFYKQGCEFIHYSL